MTLIVTSHILCRLTLRHAVASPANRPTFLHVSRRSSVIFQLTAANGGGIRGFSMRTPYILRRYMYLATTHPWRTQIATSAVIMGLATCISEIVVQGKSFQEADYLQVARMMALACLIFAPIGRCWWLWVDRIIKPGRFAPLKKTALSQITYAPVSMTAFLLLNTLTNAGSWESFIEKYRRDFKDMLLNSYKIWPAVQIINYYFLPFEARLLAASIVSLIWNTYMAYMAQKHLSENDEVELDMPGSSDGPPTK